MSSGFSSTNFNLVYYQLNHILYHIPLTMLLFFGPSLLLILNHNCINLFYPYPLMVAVPVHPLECSQQLSFIFPFFFFPFFFVLVDS